MEKWTLLRNNFLAIVGYGLVSVAGIILYALSWGFYSDVSVMVLHVISFLVVYVPLVLWGYAVIKPVRKFNFLSVLGLALLLWVPLLVFAATGTMSTEASLFELFAFTALIAPLVAALPFVMMFDILQAGTVENEALFFLFLAIPPVLAMYGGTLLRSYKERRDFADVCECENKAEESLLSTEEKPSREAASSEESLSEEAANPDKVFMISAAKWALVAILIMVVAWVGHQIVNPIVVYDDYRTIRQWEYQRMQLNPVMGPPWESEAGTIPFANPALTEEPTPEQRARILAEVERVIDGTHENFYKDVHPNFQGDVIGLVGFDPTILEEIEPIITVFQGTIYATYIISERQRAFVIEIRPDGSVGWGSWG